MFEDVIKLLNQERGTSFERASEHIFSGNISTNGDNMTMEIDLGKGFPKSFPIIRVTGSPRFIPHSSDGGKLCLFDEDSVIIKHDMPEQVLLDSFDRAIEILEMDTESQTQEVLREFYAYWMTLSPSGLHLYTNLCVASAHEYEEYTAIGAKGNQLVVSNSIEESKVILLNHMGCSQEDVEKFKIPCYRIRLRVSALPKLDSSLKWKELRNYILANITGSQKRKFNRMLSEKFNAVNRLLLLTIPSKFGDQYACVWLHRNRKKRNASLRNISDCTVKTVITTRIDQQYMLVRGGAESKLRDKSILLIGCGSVGGFLAENLCQCGVGSLDILDNDKLSVDNVHRHVLGFDDAIKGQYKSDLMKEYLESHFPYADIDNLGFVDRSAETFIQDRKRLLHYDLIISATGNPALELEINDVLHAMEDAPPFVVCFNEPYGIGGHAIGVLKKGGCLRCLYSDTLSGELVPFQGSFVREGQSFSKNISGCSSAFVEYSVLDSQQTAIMATRLIVDVLNGKCKLTMLMSWIGSAEKIREEGFETSEYYNDLEQCGKFSIAREIPCFRRCHTCGNYS